MNTKINFLIIAMIMLGISSVQSQDNTASFFSDGISIELGGGIADYQGDLDQKDGYPILEDANISGSLALRKKFSPCFDMALQYFRTNLKARKDYVNPNTGVEDELAYEELDGDLHNFSLNVYWDLTGLSAKSKEEGHVSKSSVYAYTGLGVGFAKSEITSTYDIANDMLFNSEAVVRRTNDVFPVLPIGLGFKYYVTDPVSIGLDGAFFLPFNDKVDGTARSSEKWDVYQNFSIVLGYTIGR